MGTNFYIRGHASDSTPEFHIGKRSAAGPYCWDCRVTLCVGGEKEVHFGRSKWHQACPKCHKKPTEEKLDSSAAGRELGFNASRPKKKAGVASCCSFSWAQDPGTVLSGAVFAGLDPTDECRKCARPYSDLVIQDEYNRLYSLRDFLKVLEECPLQNKDHVGKDFS